MVWILNGPDHLENEQNGRHFSTKWWPSCFTIRKPNHSKSEQANNTIWIPNMIGIWAPTEMEQTTQNQNFSKWGLA